MNPNFIVDCIFFRTHNQITIGEIGGASNQCNCPEEKCGIVVWPNFRSHPTGAPYVMCSEFYYQPGTNMRERINEIYQDRNGKDWPGCRFKKVANERRQ